MLQTSRHAQSRNVQILARHPYERDTLVDPTMKTQWGALGEKVLGDHVQVWRALKGLTGGVARSVVQSAHGEDGFEA